MSQTPPSLSDQELSEIMKALSDETRLRILRLTAREELNVQELCEITRLPQPNVSRHLGQLKHCGLVNDRRDGTRAYYSLCDISRAAPALAALLQSCATTHHEDLERLPELIARRAGESRRALASRLHQWDEIIGQLHNPSAVMYALAGLASRDMDIIDLGCGTGTMLPILARSGASIHAVDQSQDMLARARERCRKLQLDKIQFHHADIADPQLLLPAADVILMHFVLHQIASPQALLQRLRASLKPGGRLIIIDLLHHNDESARESFGSQWLGFHADLLQSWHAKAGFRDSQQQVISPTGGEPAAKKVLISCGWSP